MAAWPWDRGVSPLHPSISLLILGASTMLLHPSPCWYWRKHPAWFQAPWTQVPYYLSNWLTQVGVVGRLRYWCYCRRGPLGIKHWATGLWGCNLTILPRVWEHGMVFTGKSSKPGSCKGEVQTPPDVKTRAATLTGNRGTNQGLPWIIIKKQQCQKSDGSLGQISAQTQAGTPNTPEHLTLESVTLVASHSYCPKVGSHLG